MLDTTAVFSALRYHSFTVAALPDRWFFNGPRILIALSFIGFMDAALKTLCNLLLLQEGNPRGFHLQGGRSPGHVGLCASIRG